MELDYHAPFTDDDGTVSDTNLDDGDTGPDPSSRGPNPTRYAWSTATCNAAVHAPSTGSKIIANVRNGYPSYWCTVWFEIENEGTVPVFLAETKLQGAAIDPSTDNLVDLDQDGDNDVLVHVSELEECGADLAPGDSVQGNMAFHIENGADEDETVSWEVELVWAISTDRATFCP